MRGYGRSLTELQGGGLTFGPPKTEAGRRTVGFPELISPVLRWHLSCFAQAGNEELVFTGPAGALPLRFSPYLPFGLRPRLCPLILSLILATVPPERVSAGGRVLDSAPTAEPTILQTYPSARVTWPIPPARAARPQKIEGISIFVDCWYSG